MPVRGAASTYCLPKDSPQNLTRYSTAGARRHCSTVSHALCRYASIIVALVCWIGVEPVLGWRKSPRCNMTTEYECKTGHCIRIQTFGLTWERHNSTGRTEPEMSKTTHRNPKGAAQRFFLACCGWTCVAQTWSCAAH